MGSEDIVYAGLAEQARLIAAGDLSSRELTETLLERIERLDPKLNAFRVVLGEEALAEASKRDAQRAAGEELTMLGVPVAIKDEVDVGGVTTTFGTGAVETPAPRDSATVRRLREAGAVIIGKTNMPEFGQWPFTESVTHGITRNPWSLDHTTGGSSGGTGAAVAAGLVAAGLGGDGGGSIRIPSACCGLFGLKPERGRLSADPMPELWGALGTTGPLTRRVIDSAIFYDAARGSEPGDRWRAPEPPMSFTEAARAEPGKLRIGISTKGSVPTIKPSAEQRSALDRTAELLAELGHEVDEADLGYPDLTPALIPQVYRGVYEEARELEHPERFERATKIEAGAGRLIPGAVVAAAQRYGRFVDRRANRVFDQHDLVLTPTIPNPPRAVPALNGNFATTTIRSLTSVPYTAIWNVTGNPAASIPVGRNSEGLPLAVQIIGPHNGETEILKVASQLEQRLGWTEHRPPLDG